MADIASTTSPNPHPDAVLIACCTAFREWQYRYREACLTWDKDVTPETFDFATADALLDRMSALRTTTPEGILARFQAFVAFAPYFAEEEGHNGTDWPGLQLMALFRDAIALDPILSASVKEEARRRGRED